MSIGWRTIRVFISSTFRDMQAERDHLVRFVFPRLREELLKRRMHLVEVDLRWGVTSDQDALELCMDEINRCQPRFICILGGRYGWVPPPKTVRMDLFDEIQKGSSPAGALTSEQQRVLSRLYLREANTPEYRLRPKPRESEQRKSWEDDIAAAVEILQRARLPGAQHSITESEVHYGVLEKLDIPAFRYFYFRDPSVTSSIAEPYASDYREREGSFAAEALAALKKRITEARCRMPLALGQVSDSKLPVYQYLCAWDSASALITKLEAFGSQVYADLLSSVEAEFGASAPARLDEFAEANSAIEEFIEARVERYVVGSRKSVFSTLHQHAASSEGNPYLCVVGEPGSGKSALLGKFYLDYVTESRKHEGTAEDLVIPHFVGAGAASADLRHLLRRLCRELAAGAGLQKEVPEDFDKLREAFPAFLNEAAAVKRVVILIDAVNQMDPRFQAHALWWLPDTLPENARVILTVLKEPGQAAPALKSLRGRPVPPLEIGLPPLDGGDAEAIIDGFLDRHGKTLELEQRDLLLGKKDSNKPLYLLSALEELRTLGTYDEITQRIHELPGEILSLFRWILAERLAKEDGFRDEENHRIGDDLVRRYCSYLAVARSGLAQSDLAELVAPSPSRPLEKKQEWIPHDHLGNVAALQRLLRPYLMQRGELLDFFHLQLREAAEQEYLSGPAERRAAHSRVASHFDLTNEISSYRDPRALLELPFHLRGAERWEELFALARNEAFLRAQVKILTDNVQAPLETFQSALTGAIQTSAAPVIAEFCLRHARWLQRLSELSPVEALRANGLERAWQMADLQTFGSVVLWHLLLAWELNDSLRMEEASKTLERLRNRDLPRLSGGEAAYGGFLLAAVFGLGEESVRDLEQRLLDDAARVGFGQHLADRGHFTAALATALEINDEEIRTRTFVHIASRQAAAGQNAAARETALAIPTPKERAMSLCEIGVVQTRAEESDGPLGNFAAALFEAKRITDPEEAIKALTAIGALAANAGDRDAARTAFASAIELSADMEDSSALAEAFGYTSHDGALGELVDVAILINELSSATRAAAAMRDGGRRAIAEALIAAARARSDDSQSRRETLASAIAVARQITAPDVRANALALLADAEAKTGDLPEARVVFGLALEAIKEFPGVGMYRDVVRALEMLATMQTEAGDFGGASETADLMGNCGVRAERLAEIAVAQAEEGDFASSIATAQKIASFPQNLSGTLVAIAVTQAERGNRKSARVNLEAAAKVARRAGWPYVNGLLGKVAEGQAAAGEFPVARKTASLIDDDSDRAGALQGIALELTKKGRHKEALEVVDEIVDVDGRDEALGMVALLRTKSHQFVAALRTAKRISSGSLHDDVMKQIAKAEIEAGKFDAAIIAGTSVRNLKARAGILLDVAIAQDKAGRAADARKSLGIGVRCAAETDEARQMELLDHGDSFGSFAEDRLRREPEAGDRRLRRVFREVLNEQWEVSEIHRVGEKAEETAATALGQAQTGDFAAAVQTARMIALEVKRAETLCKIAVQQATSGFGKEAVETTALIRQHRARSLPQVAEALSKVGDRESFNSLLIPCAYYLDAALQMCSLLADLHPEQASEIAKVVAQFNGPGSR